MEGYFYLGKINKLFASKGALQVYLDTDNPENYLETESVFVRMNNQLIPFFIDSLELRHNNNAVVKFTDVDDVEMASLLLGCELYLPETSLPPLSGNRFYYHEIKGFSVIDKGFGPAGTVEEVLEYPHQAVLRVMLNGKEILIPVNDETIPDVDRVQRIVHTNAPEGLIELYLE